MKKPRNLIRWDGKGLPLFLNGWSAWALHEVPTQQRKRREYSRRVMNLKNPERKILYSHGV